MTDTRPMTPEQLLAYAAKTPPPASGKVEFEYAHRSVYKSMQTINGSPANAAPITFKVEELAKWAAPTGWALSFTELEGGKCQQAVLRSEGPGFAYKVTLERLLDKATHDIHRVASSGRMLAAVVKGTGKELFWGEYDKQGKARTYKVIATTEHVVTSSRGPLPWKLESKPAPKPPKTPGRHLAEYAVMEGRRWLDMGNGVKAVLMVAPNYVGNANPPRDWPKGSPCHKAYAKLYLYVEHPSLAHQGEPGELFMLQEVMRPAYKDDHLATTEAAAVFLASIPPATMDSLRTVTSFHDLGASRLVGDNVEPGSHAYGVLERARALVADPGKSLQLNMGQRFRGLDLHTHIGYTQKYLDLLSKVK